MSDQTQEGETRAVALFHGLADDASPLARYGSSKVVRIVADRLMKTDHGKTPVLFDEALLVGQAAIATGLSPFQPQPELWYWISIPDYGANKGKRMLTIMRGRDGTIRLAEEAARRDGTYLLPARYTQIKDEREKVELGFATTDLVFRADVTDHRTANEYYGRRKELKEEGMSSQMMDERLGVAPPSDIGYGCVTVEDKTDLEKGKNKMPHVNRAKKRAYIEALKQRWGAHVNMAQFVEHAPTDPNAYIVENEWIDVTPEGGPKTEVGVPSRGKPGDRPYDPATVKSSVTVKAVQFKDTPRDTKIGRSEIGPYAASQLRDCFEGRQNERQQAVLQFLFGNPKAEDLTGPQSRALLDWLRPEDKGGGLHMPSVLSMKEAEAIARQEMGEGYDGKETEVDPAREIHLGAEGGGADRSGAEDTAGAVEVDPAQPAG